MPEFNMLDSLLTRTKVTSSANWGHDMAIMRAKGSGKLAEIAFGLAVMFAITLGLWWLVYLVANDVWNAAWGAVTSGRISNETVALVTTGILIVAGYLIGLLFYQVRQLANTVEGLSDRVTELEGVQDR